VTMDSYDANGVKLGEAIVPNFGIEIGDNYQEGIIVNTIKTADNEAAISNFVSNWAMGIDQETTLSGPTSISTGANYFLNVSKITALVKGYNGPALVSNASMPTNPVTPTQMVYNPINLTVVQDNFQFRVTVEPIPSATGTPLYPSFTAYPIPPAVACAADDYAGYIKLLYGPSQTLPPLQSVQVSVAADSSNPCAYMLPIATCCGLYNGNFDGVNRTMDAVPPSFNVNINGSFDVLIGQFNITQTYKAIMPFQCFQWTAGYEALCEPYPTPYFVTDVCGRPSKGQYCTYSYYNPTQQSISWFPNGTDTNGSVILAWEVVNGTWNTAL